MALSATRHSHTHWTLDTHDVIIVNTPVHSRTGTRTTAYPCPQPTHALTEQEAQSMHPDSNSIGLMHGRRHAQASSHTAVRSSQALPISSAAWHDGTRHEQRLEKQRSRRQHHRPASIACLQSSCRRQQALPWLSLHSDPAIGIPAATPLVRVVFGSTSPARSGTRSRYGPPWLHPDLDGP